jgi:hypothetical protein
LAVRHSTTPRVVTVDKNPAYPLAIGQLKEEKVMPEGVKIRRIRYLNNIVEQDHRFIKKRVRSMLGFKSYETATSILSGIEAMHMMKKGLLIQSTVIQFLRHLIEYDFKLIPFNTEKNQRIYRCFIQIVFDWDICPYQLFLCQKRFKMLWTL